MNAASESLSRRGSVASRLTPGGVRVYSVRYVEFIEGRRRQKAVYLGSSPVLADRARGLIQRFRDRERWAKIVEDAARFTSVSGALLRNFSQGRGSPARRRPGGFDRT